jgi:hypothetical protein
MQLAAVLTLFAIAIGCALLLRLLRRALTAKDARSGLPNDLARAWELLHRGAAGAALAIGHRIADRARSPGVQRASIELIAWAQLSRGRPEAARNALSWLGESPELDPYCRAAVEDACGQSSWALHILELAAKRRELPREAILFRIDLHARLRGLEAACTITLRELDRIRLEDAERVVRAGASAAQRGQAWRALVDALRLRKPQLSPQLA